MPFFNRTDELEMISQRFASETAELLIVYGRRRVGKTELLTHLADSRKALYFEATDSVALDQLRDLTTELALASSNPVWASQTLTSWGAALAAIAEFVGDEQTLIILDEFQLLAHQSPQLESVLSRWWRTVGRKLPITLILAGSEISFFENDVLAGRLYGRRTGQLKLAPFLAKEASLFHPAYSPTDRVRAYSICGGIPYYLERFHDRRPLASHLLTEVFERTGLLHDEAELMLRQSIPAPTAHVAVLRSIAHGQSRNNSIAQRTQLAPGHVTKVLATLERLGLVEQLRPVAASPRSKKTAYRISDQFLRFHYRFVEPAKSQLRTRELAAHYVKTSVVPQLDHHASIAWEDVCQQHVLRTQHGVSAVGRWWGPVPTGHSNRTEEREIDVAAVSPTGELAVVGMCKWTNTKVDFDELNLLDRLRNYVPGDKPETIRYLFSRSGFTSRLTTYAESDPLLRLVTPADIYA